MELIQKSLIYIKYQTCNDIKANITFLSIQDINHPFSVIKRFRMSVIHEVFSNMMRSIIGVDAHK